MATIPRRIRAALLSAAFAAPASATPFEATLSMRFGPLGIVSFAGSGSGTSTPHGVTLPSGVFSGTGMAAAATPFARMTAFSVNLTGQRAGALQRTRFRPGLHGPIRIDGSLLVKGTVLGNSLTVLAFPLYTTHFWGSTPGYEIGIGVGPILRFSGGPSGSRYVVVYPGVWRESRVGVSSVTKMATYHVASGMRASMVVESTYRTDAFYTGEDSRTPGGLGRILLVSPTAVTMNVTGQSVRFVMENTLTIQFTPEPGTLLLVGGGAAALGALGWRRRRPQAPIG